MGDIRERADGDFELVLASGRVAVSASRDVLESLHDTHERAITAHRRFLAAWKAGIKIAGERFFLIQSQAVDAAQDKDELRPDWDGVEAAVGSLSHGERSFLVAMCGFFNREWGRDLAARFDESGNPAELAVLLDDSRRRVIAELLISYSGW